MARSTKKRRSSRSEEEPTTRRRRSSSNGKGGSFKVDFRDAQSGGSRRFPEADYKVKIAKAERSNSQQGNAQIKVTFEMLEPEKYEGKTLVDYLTLTRKAAWRIGNLFDAVNIKWSQKVMEFKTGKLVGKELGITLADDTYNGRVRSKVADYLDLETIEGILSGEDVDEDDESLDSDDASEDAEGLEDMDRAELKAYIKKNRLDVKIKKSMSDEDIVEAIEEAEGEEDSEDDDDEDLESFDDDDL